MITQDSPTKSSFYLNQTKIGIIITYQQIYLKVDMTYKMASVCFYSILKNIQQQITACYQIEVKYTGFLSFLKYEDVRKEYVHHLRDNSAAQLMIML